MHENSGYHMIHRTASFRRMRAPLLALTAALALSLMHHTQAVRAADESETELAKKTQNPVADLISVPFQSNFYFNTGTKDATVYVLNVQPVIPFKLSEDWNLITRTIMPIINQPSLLPGMESAFGMGDINPTLFYQWQRQLFENAHLAFDNGRKARAVDDAKDQKIQQLEAKLVRKNEVMAELMEAHTELKKTLGEP